MQMIENTNLRQASDDNIPGKRIQIANMKLYSYLLPVYADDNCIINSFPDLNTVILNMKHCCQDTIPWFIDNGMKVSPNKFQFMMMSSKPMEPHTIELYGGVSITPESSVEIVGVATDDRLNFAEHIRMCCIKALQLNSVARISKHLDFMLMTIIFNSFILVIFATAGWLGTFVAERIIRSQMSCKSSHWEYCVFILCCIFKTSWRTQVSWFWQQESHRVLSF